ncbi:MAG: hypothetical protein LBQ63_06565 [Deltaproteobacteria bacterium]|jgi:hypothetical protein|nr:hypothetical protein [Deltaproteobacteria bacterium]
MGNEALNFLDAPGVIKILVTTDGEGTPHAAVKQSLSHEGGEVIYWELFEHSVTNRNLTADLWYDRQVSILLFTPDERSFVVRARPRYSFISGRIFKRHYERARACYGNVDLACVWFLRPEGTEERTLALRLREEKRLHPYFNHLDRLASPSRKRAD